MKKLIICILLFSNMVFAEKIHELVIKGDLNGVIKILNLNPDKINSVDDSKLPYGSPLHFAAYYNKIEIVKYLISINDNVNKVNFIKYESIFNAFKKNNDQIVKLLTINGSTLKGILLEINRNTTVDIVKYLVENGADYNVCGPIMTPLGTAVNAENYEVAKYLKSIGAVTSYDFFDALEAGKFKEVKQFLKKAPGLVNSTRTSSGKKAIHIASERGLFRIVRYLLNIGIDPNTPTKKLITALHLASLIGKRDIIKLLLNSGARISKDEDGYTPLTFTIEHIRKERLPEIVWSYDPEDVDKDIFLDIAKTLISKGADVNSRDRKGKTNLYYAIISNEIEMIKLLLQNKADVKNIDGKGNGAMEIAKREKLPEIVKLLK